MWTKNDFPNITEPTLTQLNVLNNTLMYQSYQRWPLRKQIGKEYLKRYRQNPETFLNDLTTEGTEPEITIATIAKYELLEQHENLKNPDGTNYYSEPELFLILQGIEDGTYITYLEKELQNPHQ